jgi:hypothetical protein
MNSPNFALQPFSAGALVSQFSLTGTISRQGTRLTISYTLTGPLQELIIAPPAHKSARQWVLWETTCFEFFLATNDTPAYWEFNLSPAGHWNMFRLAGYRAGIQEEQALQALPFIVNRQPEMLTLVLEVDLVAIILPNKPLEVAISTVLQHRDGQLSYWALTHLGSEPDFHRRQGFLIRFSGKSNLRPDSL